MVVVQASNPVRTTVIIYGVRLFVKFIDLFIHACMFVLSELWVSIPSQSFLALYLLVSEIAKCID